MSNSAYLSSRGSEFEQKATAYSLLELKQYLPRLSLSQTFTIDAILPPGNKTSHHSVEDDGQAQKAMLDAYFKHYGFDALLQKHSQVDYYFGALAMLDELVGVDRDVKLAAHIWRPKFARQLVFVAHGLFDHIGLYLQLVDFLLENQYAVIAIDLPGHGLSGGDPGTISDFKYYALAVSCVNNFVGKNASRLLINEQKEKMSYVAVGQSTGCAALLYYINLERELNGCSGANGLPLFSKLALIAPLVRPRSWWFVRISFAVLSSFLKSIERKFTGNSHDEMFTCFIAEHDPLQPTRISVEWVGAMITWVKTFLNSRSQTIPTLIVQGAEDKTVDFTYNLKAIKTKFENLEIKMIDQAGHHFVNESDQYRLKGFEYINTFFRSNH